MKYLTSTITHALKPYEIRMGDEVITRTWTRDDAYSQVRIVNVLTTGKAPAWVRKRY